MGRRIADGGCCRMPLLLLTGLAKLGIFKTFLDTIDQGPSAIVKSAATSAFTSGIPGGDFIDAAQVTYSVFGSSRSTSTSDSIWSYCAVHGHDCSLPKVCLEDDCHCGAPKACRNEHHCSRLKVCTQRNHHCGRPKAYNGY